MDDYQALPEKRKAPAHEEHVHRFQVDVEVRARGKEPDVDDNTVHATVFEKLTDCMDSDDGTEIRTPEGSSEVVVSVTTQITARERCTVREGAENA